jgi:hypothetical protein
VENLDQALLKKDAFGSAYRAELHMADISEVPTFSLEEPEGDMASCALNVEVSMKSDITSS